MHDPTHVPQFVILAMQITYNGWPFACVGMSIFAAPYRLLNNPPGWPLPCENDFVYNTGPERA